MYFLGIDLGSSSIKLSVIDGDKGNTLVSISVPDFEMDIIAQKIGWAEQHPDSWWEYIKTGITILKSEHGIDLQKIAGIGIAYQMHGLVLTDANLNPVRPSIIWCDSRAAAVGNVIYDSFGHENSQKIILGSPGNFTAAKLKWVKDNEPAVFAKAKYMMLPGDYIAAKLSGIAQISTSGLSEAALWNFTEARPATEIMEAMDLPLSLIPEIVPNFGQQAVISKKIAEELGINPNAKITYRAGDQPNNAFSLNVLNPGEIAATAGTSAVVYAVSSTDAYDIKNRINTFLHVNNTPNNKSNGIMLCINGAGILYQWVRKITSLNSSNLISYDRLNAEAAKAKPGSEGLLFYPFGNGVERIFNNKEAFSGIQNLNFNIHKSPELIRAACEGIVYAMNYGFDVMKETGVSGNIVRAGKANLFLNPVFREIFVNTTQTTVELFNTSGAEGAARGAAYGYGFYKTPQEAFSTLTCLERIEPNTELTKIYSELYNNWKNKINIELQQNEYNSTSSF